MTEDLNRRWYEANTGQVITDVQRQVRHPALRWMAATLDGAVEASGAVFEAKFMLPWSFSEEAAAEKHMAQLQHNMWVVAARSAVLSVITGGGKWVEIKIHADPLYQHLIVTAERKFWRCVETGEPPRLFGVEPPKPRIEAVRIVDMSSSNAWAEFAAIFARTRPAYLEHEKAKAELKSLVPEDAQQAVGHGVRARRSKSGAITFELLKLRTAMQQSSSSIGSLAAALAKAQIELVNPEKSMVATIRTDGTGRGEQIFRYAPLSSGLDIVRKTLGKHEIAAVQATAIDHATGIVSVTTRLCHSSGEWIASDWPVCPLDDMASPKRMGAALTYARRYALFALVGIAGEDDLDAPDLNAPEPAEADNKTPPSNGGSRGGQKYWPQKKTQVKRAANKDFNSANPRLKAQLSAVLRDQLMSELKGVKSAEDAAIWARRILPAKNSLDAPDARQIEDAFQARLAVVQEATDRTDGLASAVMAAPKAEGAQESTRKSRPASIDKSDLPYPEPRRVRDRDHVRFVTKQPCLICGRRPADPHHLRFTQQRALGRKVSDEFTVPLCRGHHREAHRSGDEAAWWKEAGVDPTITARALWLKTHPLPTISGQTGAGAATALAAVATQEELITKAGPDDETKPITVADTK